MGSTLSPHQFIAHMEGMGGAFHAIIIAGLNENALDQTTDPDLYAAVLAFRTGVRPLWEALETLVVQYSLECTPEEYWEGCE